MEEDIDVTDIESENDKISVFTPHAEYGKARTTLQAYMGDKEFEVDEIQCLAQTMTPISCEDLEMFEKLVDLLTEVDDVQNVYHSAQY